MWLSTPPTPGLKKSQTISTLSFPGASAAPIAVIQGAEALLTDSSWLESSYAQTEREDRKLAMRRTEKTKVSCTGPLRGNLRINFVVLVGTKKHQHQASKREQPICYADAIEAHKFSC